ncbi:MAG: GNAT family N-acetyltransferase [Halieaceae bacterium]|nr:GNAT family N-acetyltransferase [Halieaceae bacterium]
MTDEPKLEVVSWNLNRETLRSIRDKVFIEEQGVPVEIEHDDHDETATHFLITDKYIALGCGRLLPDGKIGRMAVLPEHRGKGLGHMLLNYIVDYAKHRGYQRLYLHSQSHANGFYEAAGFSVYGEPFEEAGIAHSAMELPIDYSGADQFITGVQYPEPFATLALELARTASRNLRIYSYYLDHDVFDSAEFADAVSTLARSGRYSDIRILISDPRPLVSRGHRLLQLARRLSSTISIRVLAEHPELPEATYVVRDTDGVVYKPDERSRDGFYEPGSRASAKKFVDGFDALWRWGERDPRLRQLTI